MSVLIVTFRLLAVCACNPRWQLSDRHRVSSDDQVVGERAHTTLGGDVHPEVCASASNVVPTCWPARASRAGHCAWCEVRYRFRTVLAVADPKLGVGISRLSAGPAV